MPKNTITRCCIFMLSVALLPVVAAADENPSPQRPPGAGSASTASAISPWTGSPLAYPAVPSDTVAQIDEMMRGAAALREQGSFSDAMSLYNRALAIAPRYAEGYRQRALTLLRLGNRKQAQVDYNRYLAFDPNATAQARDEIALFAQSGRARPGEVPSLSHTVGGPTTIIARSPHSGSPQLSGEPPQQHVADMHFSWAKEAFQGGDYDSALRLAQQSERDFPHARTHALTAQIFAARGNFPAAAAEARAAITMNPVVDWQMLSSFYGYTTPRLARQLQAVEQYVAQNPSSGNAHFLLGYQQLALGNADAGHAQLAIASVIEPNDVAATALLAKDGVEVVSANRPLFRTPPPAAGAEVARRLPAPPAPHNAAPTQARPMEVTR